MEQKIFVNIIGAGGTGAWAAELIYKAAANLTFEDRITVVMNIIDPDTVEFKNLNRQHFIGVESIGMNKALYLVSKLEKMAAATVAERLLKPREDSKHFPRITFNAIQQLVFKDAEGHYSDELASILFVGGSINILCVDNNSTRLQLEQEFNKRLKYHMRSSSTLAREAYEVTNVRYGINEVLAKMMREGTFGSNEQVIPFLVHTEDTTYARAAVVEGEEIRFSEAFDLEMKIAPHEHGFSKVYSHPSLIGYVDAGNSDVEVSINAALSMPVIGYEHVYDADMTLPDQLITCADREETTNIPQTTLMNVIAATKVSAIAMKMLEEIGTKRADPETTGTMPFRWASHKGVTILRGSSLSEEVEPDGVSKTIFIRLARQPLKAHTISIKTFLKRLKDPERYAKRLTLTEKPTALASPLDTILADINGVKKDGVFGVALTATALGTNIMADATDPLRYWALRKAMEKVSKDYFDAKTSE